MPGHARIAEYFYTMSQLMLMEIWRRGQTLQAFVALGKLVTPLQTAFVASDCAGGLDKRTQA